MFLALEFTLFSFLETSCSFLQILFIGIGNIHFIFMCRIWFVLDLECMSDPCCFESFFAWGDSCFLLHADFFSAWQERFVLHSLICFKKKFQFSLSFALFASMLIDFLFFCVYDCYKLQILLSLRRNICFQLRVHQSQFCLETLVKSSFH